MPVIEELQQLAARTGLTLKERVALKLALAILEAPPEIPWTDDEYLALPGKFELIGGYLCMT